MFALAHCDVNTSNKLTLCEMAHIGFKYWGINIVITQSHSQLATSQPGPHYEPQRWSPREGGHYRPPERQHLLPGVRRPVHLRALPELPRHGPIPILVQLQKLRRGRRENVVSKFPVPLSRTIRCNNDGTRRRRCGSD